MITYLVTNSPIETEIRKIGGGVGMLCLKDCNHGTTRFYCKKNFYKKISLKNPKAFKNC